MWDFLDFSSGSFTGKPVLKWLGGKSRLANIIVPHLSSGNRLVEPFVGSGAIFMASTYDSYLLCDTNPDIINIHSCIKEQLQNFIEEVTPLFQPENNQLEKYLEFRQELNNTEFNLRRAALFLYLNKHCFNGLCRYNSKGKFNAHFGNYTDANLPLDNINQFHQKSSTAEFKQCDFRECFSFLRGGDVVYCDPPYIPISATASFVGYSKEKFNWQDQTDLANLARWCRDKNIRCVISNSDTELSRQLYHDADIFELDVTRTISVNGDGRGKTKEILAVYY